MVEGPSIATVDDFDAVEACVNACFLGPVSDGGMAARHPHCLQRTPQHMQQYLLMKEAGKVVSCLLIADQLALVDGGELPVAGIGQVATLPEYRGQQLMSVLLNAAIEQMQQRRFALAELGGDRVRYGRFGWETAGREWQFTLNPRSLENAAPARKLDIRQYIGDPRNSRNLREIIAIHDAEPRRVRRSETQYRDLMNRFGKDVWLAGDGATTAAYLVHDSNRDVPLIFEFGGRNDAIHALLAHVVTKPTMIFSPWSHPANTLFFELAAQWQLASPRMIRIMDLHTTLSAFANQMTQRARAAFPNLTADFAIQIAETAEQVTVSFDNGSVQIAPGPSAAPIINLPRRVLTHLLFGPTSASAVLPNPQCPALLDAVFPLDFTIWRNETV